MERSTPSRHMCTMPELPSEKSSTVTGMITVAELKELARTKTIDTVVVGLTDCYGRLVGKRCAALTIRFAPLYLASLPGDAYCNQRVEEI